MQAQRDAPSSATPADRVSSTVGAPPSTAATVNAVHELALRVPAGSVDARRLLEPGAVTLAPGVVQGARSALAASLDHVYLWCVPAMALSVVCALFLPELPLRTTAPHTVTVTTAEEGA